MGAAELVSHQTVATRDRRLQRRHYRIPRPGTSRPVIPREGPPDPTLVIATYNSISGKQPYVCGRGKHGTFPPSLTPPS